MIVEKIAAVKLFAKGAFRLGHFEIRNGHVSDYNKSSNRKESAMIDDLDQFDKEIDNWLKLERLWKINEYLNYQPLTPASISQEVTPTLARSPAAGGSSASAPTNSSS